MKHEQQLCGVVPAAMSCAALSAHLYLTKKSIQATYGTWQAIVRFDVVPGDIDAVAGEYIDTNSI